MASWSSKGLGCEVRAGIAETVLKREPHALASGVDASNFEHGARSYHRRLTRCIVDNFKTCSQRKKQVNEQTAISGSYPPIRLFAALESDESHQESPAESRDAPVDLRIPAGFDAVHVPPIPLPAC